MATAAYVLKNEAIDDLVVAIDTVLQGRRYVSPAAGSAAPTGPQRSAEVDKGTLSERERDVLRLLAAGQRTKEIAEQLGISAKTVETYRSRLMLKLGIDNLPGPVKFAIRAGILAPGALRRPNPSLSIVARVSAWQHWRRTGETVRSLPTYSGDRRRYTGAGMRPGAVIGDSPAACLTSDGSNTGELSMSPVFPHADTDHLASGRGAGRRLSTLTLALALAVLGGCAASPQQDTASAQLAKELDRVLGDVPGPIHYFAKQVDLNGGGRAEYVVHVAGPMVCGSGGCDTFVFAQEGSGLRLVSRTSVTRPPIVVASTTTQGWRDLVVRVTGGGIIPGYDARLQFDGRTYPANPTVPPAEPLKAPASGEVAIPTFASFTEGRLLRAGAK